MSKYVFGAEKIDRVLRDFPESIQLAAVRAAARSGGNVIKESTKRKIAAIHTGKKGSSEAGQSKAILLMRSVKVINSKSKKNPGVNVYFKGQNLPVGKRFWKPQNYAVLLGGGASGERFTRGGNAKSRGKFEGYGNPIEAANASVGGRARRRFYRSLSGHVSKALDRAVKRG
jgi:hypothetical protein